MTMNIHYIARGRLVLADTGGQKLETVGMLDTPQLATLAAAGMNRITDEASEARHRDEWTTGERLIAGTDFRDPHAETTLLPRVGRDGHPV